MSKSSGVSKKRFNVEKLIFNSIIVLIMLYIATALVKQEITIRKYKSQIKDIHAKIEAEKKDIDDIKKDIEQAENIDNIEKIARERLKMIKPGEIMYVDVDKD
ncbi:cell division protein DivIC [Peptoclostridium litorale DSM 5388]|uniref:Septum formation initiator n=1 Tax=Peptoclostridium litorale DSM 5388 TaxID=1121324 RepID=A0A069RES0_PEPLI|nr:septum formation initiator family protein [Peptoclostridium litorale]KDR94685.1 hypothetical protein CLIT_13c00070 [Peptoclostridium litorale DSM 5388]SIO32598.1 cell division protein DivIC [Peptoclostridium litorale DSM 5388]